MDEKLLGKCGFYCGCCPTYIKRWLYRLCGRALGRGLLYPRLRLEARHRLLWHL